MPRFVGGMPSYLRQLETIQDFGEFNPEPKIDEAAIMRRAVQQARASMPAVAFGTGMAGPKMGGAFNNFLNAISFRESRNNYGAVNPSSGALGRFQVMPSNVGPWSQEILGRRITPRQFLRSPQLQDRIATAKLSQYFRHYGPRGAAEAWYGGPGSIGKSYVRGYSNAILRRMGLR